MRGLLALEDGSIFPGDVVGALRDGGGEVVFNTAMTGYQEVLTDPSYHGQIVVFTTPHLGNYGIHPGDDESRGPQIAGAVMREITHEATHVGSVSSLPEYLLAHGVFALAGIDTRALTLRIRSGGALRGWLTTEVEDPQAAVERARAVPPMERVPAVRSVTTAQPREWQDPFGSASRDRSTSRERARGSRSEASSSSNGESVSPAEWTPHVVVIDYGVKWNILRELEQRGCRITILPAQTEIDEIARLRPDGVVLSNGPGDPRSIGWALPTVRAVIESYPTLAICMGHQLVGLAYGCTIEKLPFGHHGANHPVKDLERDTVAVTSQNHNYAIAAEPMPEELRVTHLNLNDQTVQGVRHKTRPLWSYQFHPEASPGPHDAESTFDRFLEALYEQRMGQEGSGSGQDHDARWGHA